MKAGSLVWWFALDLHWKTGSGGGDNIALGERFRDRGFKNGLIDEFRVFTRELTALEAAAVHDEKSVSAFFQNGTAQLAAAQRAMFREYFLATVDTEWRAHLEIGRAHV